MSERPIGFTRPMRDAIRAGRKTQTRRVIRRQPPDDCAAISVGVYHPTKVRRDGEQYPGEPVFGAHSEDGEWGSACPYGGPGDRLWVREPWRLPARYDAMPPRSIVLLDGDSVWYDVDGVAPHGCYADSRYGRKRNALHMPRWAARTFLRVTDVRAQRLQEISEDDAAAEGARREFEVSIGEFVHSRKWNAETASTHKLGFKHIWDSINATRGYGWASNPWVWAISFEVE